MLYQIPESMMELILGFCVYLEFVNVPRNLSSSWKKT